MKVEMKINDYEREILKILNDNRINLSISDISMKSGFGWRTVKKYLNNLEENNWVIKNNNWYRINI